MKYINKQRKPKAIWGTLIQAGIGLGTSVVGSLIEKEKMRQQMDVENKTKYDTEYNNQLANDKLLASNYQFKGNSNMKTYFKKGGRINRRFTKGGSIDNINFMDEVNKQRDTDLQNAPLAKTSNNNNEMLDIAISNVGRKQSSLSNPNITDINLKPEIRYIKDNNIVQERFPVDNTNTNTKSSTPLKGSIKDPTGDKNWTYEKQNGKWVAYNTKNGKSFNLSDNPKYKYTIDILEGRVKPISKSSTKSTKSSTPIVSNPKAKVAEIVASPINKSNDQSIYNQYKEYYRNIDKNGFPKSPNSPTPYINRPKGGYNNINKLTLTSQELKDEQIKKEESTAYQRNRNKKLVRELINKLNK